MPLYFVGVFDRRKPNFHSVTGSSMCVSAALGVDRQRYYLASKIA